MTFRIREAIRMGAVDPFSAALYHGGGKGGPPAPDYTGAAVAQSAASKDIATQQNFANRPQINTPWGQQTWDTSAGVDPSTGQPITNWTSNINLTPQQQEALNAQQGIQKGRSEAAQTLLGQATGAFETPFDWQNLPQVSNINDAQSSAFQKMSGMLQPGRSLEQDAQDTKLANMGLSRGSEAFSRANADLSGRWAQQDKGLLAQAMGEGRSQIGLEQDQRQRAIAEQAQRRGMPLNELNALLTQQQVQMPQMPSAAGAAAGQAPQLLSAANMQNQAAQQAAQAGQIDWGALAGSVAMGAGMAGMF